MTTQIETLSAEAVVADEGDGHLLDHAYDGIREYDNPLPGWWRAVFIATIVFAAGYFAAEHLTHWTSTPAETYKRALVGWQAGYKGGPGENGPAVSEELLANGAENPDIVARGAGVFAARCTGCHADNASGKIGPNLTDRFQIHGTTRLDLYSTIVGGAPGTAMIAWGETLKPDEIIAVASFVSSLRGKNLPGKEPQGAAVPALAH
ncbi:MAG TPA: cbb3-type cytochrome c oxidase N-terminal domain-containing protein [Kofleriaceae bacterium]|nr:cbb3-type cytochrome c oxidase N-terminal domain-containing protein [Kofleriaceae bacterium]